MKTRLFSILSVMRFFMLPLFALLSLQINTTAFIVTEDHIPLIRQPRQINIKNYEVQVSIDKQIATTKITQVFHNPNNYDVEGKYFFPIPKNVSITNFTMHVNGEPLDAKILDKDTARTIYEDIVRKRKDPALLEYIGHGMVQARVYPIHAHSDLRISFEYSEILKADNGSIKYRHSLGSPPLDLLLPDPLPLSPGTRVLEKPHQKSKNILDKVSITVNINSEKNIVNLYSPTHELSINKSGLTKTTVHCTEENIGPFREFLLCYTVPQDEIGFNILSYKENDEDGFFLAMMSPNISKKDQQIVAKNIVFVVDRSGSMGGKKMQQAKSALQFCLQNLNEQDSFNIISFDDTIDQYKSGLVQASHNEVQQATSYVDNLYARGCTNIDGALETALQQLTSIDNPNMIIFLTDGLPNVGESNVTRIIENAKKRNRTNARIFSFGVGYDVNTTLLDKISLDNKGASDYVQPSENIETTVSNFYKKVANPVLTDLLLQIDGTEIKEIFPIDLPDLFHGSQLLVLGRYTNGGNVTVNLSGKQNGVEKQYIFATKFAENNINNDFLPRLWATRKIGYLIDNIVLNGKNKELVDEIIRLSKKYGIITEYTSYLVDVDAQEFTRNETSTDMIDMTCKSLCHASHDQVGKSAVMRAQNHQCLRESATVCNNYAKGAHGKSAQEKIRTIRNHTFFLKDGIWIDTDHTDASKIVKIKIFSDAYFEFANNNPDLTIYLALGKNIILKTDAGSIQIYDEKK